MKRKAKLTEISSNDLMKNEMKKAVEGSPIA
jgi:hypothetical protein